MMCFQAHPSIINISHSLQNESATMSLESGYITSTEVVSVDRNRTVREMMITKNVSEMPLMTTSGTFMHSDNSEGESTTLHTFCKQTRLIDWVEINVL